MAMHSVDDTDMKANYYDFIADLDENEMKLKSYTDTVPKEMTNSNENFISALKPISKGGTYSDREIEFTKNELDKINEEVIKTGKEEREKSNEEKMKDIRSECEAFIKNITDKYNKLKIDYEKQKQYYLQLTLNLRSQKKRNSY